MPAHLTNRIAAKLARPLLAAALALSVGVTSVQAGALPVTAAHPASDAPTSDNSVATVATKVYLPIAVSGNNSGSADSETQIYWGALVDGLAPSPENLQNGGAFKNFEASVNKSMAILHWGQPWEMKGAMQPFQTSYFQAVRNRGSIPMLDWGSWALGGGVNQTKYRLSTIAAGTYDSYIRQWARDAKAWGHPFFLRFDWEMNGNWQFPWSAQLNGNTANDYINAWRHVHSIFTQEGANNASWVWCPNIAGGTTLPFSSLYPGDDYVDWTCLDGYNFYDTWLNSSAVFNGEGINWLYNSYEQLLALAPDKPIMIGETSSLEAGDGGAKKAAWITEMLAETLPSAMPQIKALVWFNWDANSVAHASLPLDSSPAATNAFAAAIASNYYVGAQFGNLNASPIPAP